MRRNIWDILAWVALAIFLIWAILKVAGYINTPLIIELIPYLSGAYFVGRIFQKVDITVDEVKLIKNDVNDIDKRLQTLEIKNSMKK